MTASADRSSTPRLATALAFALVVVALSGGQAGAIERAPSLDEAARTRLLAAAAVAAARDLLGVEHSTSFWCDWETRPVTSFEPRPASTLMPEEQRPPGGRPAPRLTNLPPPIC